MQFPKTVSMFTPSIMENADRRSQREHASPHIKPWSRLVECVDLDEGVNIHLHSLADKPPPPHTSDFLLNGRRTRLPRKDLLATLLLCMGMKHASCGFVYCPSVPP